MLLSWKKNNSLSILNVFTISPYRITVTRFKQYNITCRIHQWEEWAVQTIRYSSVRARVNKFDNHYRRSMDIRRKSIERWQIWLTGYFFFSSQGSMSRTHAPVKKWFLSVILDSAGLTVRVENEMFLFAQTAKTARGKIYCPEKYLRRFVFMVAVIHCEKYRKKSLFSANAYFLLLLSKEKNLSYAQMMICRLLRADLSFAQCSTVMMALRCERRCGNYTASDNLNGTRTLI